jgi:hypothetical protein
MLALISTLFCWLGCRLRSRTQLELKLIPLRHQVAVLHRQQRRRLRLCSIDRLVWVWLYRVSPHCLEAIVLVKPATVIQWHRQGFRLYWRWRSRSGRRPVAGETRKLIREMCLAIEMKRRNPYLGSARSPSRSRTLLASSLRKMWSDEFWLVAIDRDRTAAVAPGSRRSDMPGTVCWSVDLFRAESLLLKSYWVMVVMDVFTRRIIGFRVAAANLDRTRVCRMFNRAIARQTMARHLSSDHDPLSTFIAGARTCGCSRSRRSKPFPVRPVRTL